EKGCAAVHLDDARAIGHQATGFTKLQEADSGKALPGHYIHNRPCITDEHGVLIHSHSIDPFVRHQSEGSFELMRSLHWKFLQLKRQQFGSRRHSILPRRCSSYADRIEEDPDTLDMSKCFFEETQALGSKLGDEEARPCDVATRTGHTLN